MNPLSFSCLTGIFDELKVDVLMLDLTRPQGHIKKIINIRLNLDPNC